MTHSIRTHSFLLAIIALIVTVATVGADEHRQAGDLFIATYTNTSEQQYYSQTIDTDSSSFYLKAQLRAWGEAPNPLKAESSNYVYNSNAVTTQPGIWTGYYGVYPAHHTQQASPSPIFDYYYTSASTYNSSACWFNNGIYGGCSSTLAEQKP